MELPAKKPSFFFIALALLLLAKFLAQNYFFIGLTHAEYGEELYFLNNAIKHSWLAPGSYFSWMSRWESVSDWSGNPFRPDDMYIFRVAALFPNGWFVGLFGKTEYAVCLFTMLAGILSVGMVALCGRALGHPMAGLYAAVCLALVPAHTIYTSRLNTDMPQFFYLCLMTYFLIVSCTKLHTPGAGINAAAAGVSGGLVYLSKLPLGILATFWGTVVPVLHGYSTALSDLKPGFGDRKSGVRKGLKAGGLVAAGFLFVFISETIFYHYFLNQWFLHWRVMGGNAKNLPFWKSLSTPWNAGPLTIYIYRTGWRGIFEYARMAAGYDHDLYEAPLLGFVPAVFLLAIPIAFFRRSEMGLAKLIIFGSFLYYVYIEIFCVYPEYHDRHLTLTYYHKNHRYFLPCLIGMCLTIGLAAERIEEWWRNRLGKRSDHLSRLSAFLPIVALFAVVAYGSAAPLKHWTARFRNSLGELRAAAQYIDQNGKVSPADSEINYQKIYVELDMRPYFEVFLNNPAYQVYELFKNLNLSTLCGGYAIVGGDHGLGVWQARDKTQSIHPALIDFWREESPPPPGWETIKRIPGYGITTRMPMRILKLPECSADT